jgi:hypothetical protein
VLASDDFAANESGALEHHQVLGDGIERNRKRPRDRGHRGRAALEISQDRAARAIRHGPKNGIERSGTIFNHSVEY